MPQLSLRTCIFCRTIRPQKEMLRLTIHQKHQAIIDQGKNLGGRGTYVCQKLCLKNLRQKQPQLLNKALRQKIYPGALD